MIDNKKFGTPASPAWINPNCIGRRAHAIIASSLFGKTPSFWPALVRDVSHHLRLARDSIDLRRLLPEYGRKNTHFLVTVVEPEGSRLLLSGLLLHDPEETMRILAGTVFALCLAAGPAVGKDWKEYDYPEQGVAIQFPAKPEAMKVDLRLDLRQGSSVVRDFGRRRSRHL